MADDQEQRIAETDRQIAEHNRQIEAHDAKFMELAVGQYNFWLDLAYRIEHATTIADRKILSDEMRDRAKRARAFATRNE